MGSHSGGLADASGVRLARCGYARACFGLVVRRCICDWNMEHGSEGIPCITKHTTYCRLPRLNFAPM